MSTHTLGRGKGKGSGKESGNSIFKGVNAAKESQTPEKEQKPLSEKWERAKEKANEKLETEKKFREEHQKAYKGMDQRQQQLKSF